MSRWVRTLSLVVLQCLAVTAVARDAEPNNTCPGQHIGMPDLPYALDGSLDTPPDVPDVDFFRFDLTPGVELVADLQGASTGAGTLEDPLLGLFDSECNLIDINDDGGLQLNARLFFPVPDDGVIILAATSFADSEFTGNGFHAGSYTLTLAHAPPPIRSISGRLVDARDGRPLTAGDPTYALVTLMQCEASSCQPVAVEFPDGQGRFTFSGDVYGLREGEYQLSATATGYEEGEQRTTEAFHVAAGAEYEFGELALEPNALEARGIRLCRPLPPEGGVCRYSVRLRNNGDEPFSGRVWSIVDYVAAGGDFVHSFQVGTGNAQVPQPEYVWVRPGDSRIVAFHLPVPSAWRALDDGGFACITVSIGRAPFAVHNGAISLPMGCLTRDANGYQLSPPSEVNVELKAGAKNAPSPGGMRAGNRRLER